MNQLPENNIPICIDLDKTLVKTDLLQEAIVGLIKSNPINILLIFVWISKGLVHFKNQVFSKSNINFATLPYNQDLIAYIKQLKENGSKIYLVTASVQAIADGVGKELGIFDACYGTREDYNLKGSYKKAFLIENFGDKNYIYAGDSKADLKVWTNAAGAIVIGSKSFAEQVSKTTKVVENIKGAEFSFKKIVKAIRVYQWVKNVLLFLPLLLAHKIGDMDLLIKAITGFFAFSFISSSVYVFNDLLDLEADRIHPRKRFRPFASGDISAFRGLFIGTLLFILANLISFSLNWKFGLVVLIYFTTSSLYSIKLKQIPLLDIFIIAGLFTIRMFAGAQAVQVPLSSWLLMYALFLFLGLASIKRYNELLQNIKNNKSFIAGRGYQKEDVQLIQILGVSCGMMSILVYLLYVNSPQIALLYSNSKYLILNTPLLLIWVLRLWYLTNHGKMTDDPIVFTLKDKVSYLILGGVMLITILAAI